MTITSSRLIPQASQTNLTHRHIPRTPRPPVLVVSGVAPENGKKSNVKASPTQLTTGMKLADGS